jgi:hypothetical protein
MPAGTVVGFHFSGRLRQAAAQSIAKVTSPDDLHLYVEIHRAKHSKGDPSAVTAAEKTSTANAVSSGPSMVPVNSTQGITWELVAYTSVRSKTNSPGKGCF